MKIQILSDLHTEFWPNINIKWLIPKEPVDVLVLAGDIGVENNLEEVLTEFKKYYNTVFFIPGNHEYYKSSFKKIDKIVHGYSQDSYCRSTTLQAGVTSYQHICGTTLWFEDQPGNEAYKNLLNDFLVIEDFEPEVYERNKKGKEWLSNITEDTVVVTHHCPSPQSIPERYKGSELNRFFVCDMESLILDKKPKMWIHGHTHDSFDYMIGQTRVICNPFGYAAREENPNFKPHLIVEV